ncbi:DUF6817 domain-containing protein [Rugosimonospora africana]|uniref:DUF6817 domain-containing protein n=1 Tax=Rugosimonospora africana TaxID=556532 RepID=A0A8J3VPP0_9ACTN|nr:hypothetical protein [Rugosimonospora africana]GIH14304.1 hypothetical protein Raf01_24760 [Rugosimonospora africana]
MDEILHGPAHVERVTEFLRARGAADLAHPGGTLLAHLLRVSQRLADWGASGDVGLAGLCHAAYGTDGFAQGLLELTQRASLAELIGERAEALVYLYGSCDRTATYPRLGSAGPPVFRDRFTGAEHPPAEEQVRAFLDITAANELDVFSHNEELAARHGAGLYRVLAASRDRMSDAAWAAVHHDLGDRVPVE